MAYMAQQWLTSAVRDAFKDRADAAEQAAEAARVHAWLESLPLERAAVAALVEPIAALEDGLAASAGLTARQTRSAARSRPDLPGIIAPAIPSDVKKP
jgi:hypothetical protein